MQRSDGRTLYLIRHGQTAWNLSRRLQGSQDSALTARGRDQAVAAAAVLLQLPPVRLIASTLGRARATADIIAAELDLSVTHDERLAEFRYGEAEGLTREEIAERMPGCLEERDRDMWNFRWPGGESFADAALRAAGFVEEVLLPDLARSEEDPLAIVGHETMNMIVLGRILKLSPTLITSIGQPNNIVYRVAGRQVDHRRSDPPPFAWQKGILQKHGGEVITP